MRSPPFWVCRLLAAGAVASGRPPFTVRDTMRSAQLARILTTLMTATRKRHILGFIASALLTLAVAVTIEVAVIGHGTTTGGCTDAAATSYARASAARLIGADPASVQIELAHLSGGRVR